MRNNWIKDEIRKDAITTILEKFQGDQVRMMKKATNYLEADVYDNVEEELNIPYVNHEGIPLAMDVFKPIVEAGTELPVIISIHGGGLVTGDRKAIRNFARLLAHKGYLVFTIDYRLVPRANVCDQLDDVCAGLDFIGTKLADYDVDFGRIFMVGESAGAYLATYAAAMKNSRPLQRAIGHEPSRMIFRGIGLFSGMFYTQLHDPIGMMLSEQFYGEKTIDENFRKYMDPEHSEIIDNLPPAFFVTSRGDFLNNYTLKYQKAMEETGKKTHLVYYGEKDLGHAFPAFNPTLPQSIEAIDKMLEWFESNVSEERKKAAKGPSKKEIKTAQRIEDGSIREQKAWQYIYEINSVNDERLDAIALEDATGKITYRKMFRMWERYAAAFSGMGITGENKSRVGIVGLATTEMLSAIYSLNMVGAMVSCIPANLSIGSQRWKTLIKEEGLTDLFIMDTFIDPKGLMELIRKKEELGLKNIILVHVELDRKKEIPAVIAFNEINYRALRHMNCSVYWSDMLEKYEGYDISYGRYKKDDVVLAVHTSGTTKGTHKPMFFTDFAWNAASHRLRSCEEVDNLYAIPKAAVVLDISGSYVMFDQIHYVLSFGGVVCETHFQPYTHDSMYVIRNSSANTLLTASNAFRKFFDNPVDEIVDFSHVMLVILGGGYTSGPMIKKINEFIRSHGGSVQAINGYGLSELGGACIVARAGTEDDSIGYPLDGVNVRILDESDGKFHTIEEGPRTGTMFINSDGMCTGKLGDKVFYETTLIEGLPYIDTFDMVNVKEDGSLTYVGRSNRFFVNTEGVKFNAGVVEVAISSQEEIEDCVLAPEYDKDIHDTIPVLYIKVSGDNKRNKVKSAIINAYTDNELLHDSRLPAKCVISDDLPYNANGKVDVYRITKGEVNGDAYDIKAHYRNGILNDIEFYPCHFHDALSMNNDSGNSDNKKSAERTVGILGAVRFAGKWGLL